jgi:hypothetical protein
VIKLRRRTWVRHVLRSGERKVNTKFQPENTKEGDHFGDAGVDATSGDRV